MRWRKAKIGEIAEVKGGKRLPPGFDVQDEPTQHPYLRVVDFSENGVNTSTVKFISKEAHERIKRYTISARDVYVSIAGTIGRVGMVPEELSGANLTENAAKITNLSDLILPEFLLSFLRSAIGQQTMKNAAGGTSQPKLALFKIADIEVPVPDLPTQQRIAGILSAYDDLIENNRRRIGLLEQAARLLYREWFVHLRFHGHETAKIVDGLPEGWRQGNVGDLGQVITGKTPSKKVAENFGGGIPFIKTPDMHGNIFVLGSEETLSEQGAKTQSNKTIPAGSVLVSCIGSVGVVAMTSQDSQFNQQINAVVPANGTSQFYCYFVLSALKPRLEAIGGGATMANVNKSKFESLSICLPSVDAQRSFQEAAQPLFDMLLVLSRQNAKLTRARDLLLPRLMDGRIPV